MLIVFGFNVVEDGLRDVVDSRFRGTLELYCKPVRGISNQYNTAAIIWVVVIRRL